MIKNEEVTLFPKKKIMESKQVSTQCIVYAYITISFMSVSLGLNQFLDHVCIFFFHYVFTVLIISMLNDNIYIIQHLYY